MKLAQKGFTLVEILISLLLVSVGIVALQKAYNVGTKAGSDIEHVEIAMNLAQARMEEIKNKSFSQIVAAGPTADSVFTNFTVTVTLAGTEPMRVNVIVAWTAGGETGTFTLSTLVIRPF